MLSDEERKAIEIEDSISILENTDLDINNIYSIDLRTYNVAVKTVVEVIKKQSKEIEHQIEKRANQKKELAILNAKQIKFNKLVNTVNSYKGQFKRQEKEIEELKEKDDANLAYYDQIYQNGIYTGQKAVEEKIKAKIEEYENKIKKIRSKKLINEPEDTIVITRYAHYISVLQSLLEKE